MMRGSSTSGPLMLAHAVTVLYLFKFSTIFATLDGEQDGSFHCSEARVPEIDVKTGKVKICESPRHCSPGKSCLPSAEKRSVFVCCDPYTGGGTSTNRKKRNFLSDQYPQCGHDFVPYFPFGSINPLTCNSDAPGQCPTAFRCLPSAVSSATKLCCLNTTGAVRLPPNPDTNGRSANNSNCPPVAVGALSTEYCKSGGEPHFNFLEDKPMTGADTVLGKPCGPPTPKYKWENQKAGVNWCCPDYGSCPGGEAPFISKNNVVAECDNVDQKGACPPDYNCEETNKGHKVCCKLHGKCPGGDNPLFKNGAAVTCNPSDPNSCGTGAGGQKYGCKKDLNKGSIQNICCPEGGDCPEGFDPLIDSNGKPKPCNIFDDNPCKNNHICLGSSTGGTICCQDI